MKTFIYAVVVLFVACFSLSSKAATHLYRLTWDSDPSHEAVIGFSPKSVDLGPERGAGRDVWHPKPGRE